MSIAKKVVQEGFKKDLGANPDTGKQDVYETVRRLG